MASANLCFLYMYLRICQFIDVINRLTYICLCMVQQCNGPENESHLEFAFFYGEYYKGDLCFHYVTYAVSGGADFLHPVPVSMCQYYCYCITKKKKKKKEEKKKMRVTYFPDDGQA